MATMRDVAERAGVSLATVSFVVNATKPVTDATRLRVETAMAELGFRRNVLARALASRRTRIIALLFPALQHRLGSTAVSIFTSAAEAAAARGYTLVLSPIDDGAAPEGSEAGAESGAESGAGGLAELTSSGLVELTSSGLVDGVILMAVQLDDPRVARLDAAGTPFTLIGRTRDPSAQSFVDVDFEGIVTEAVDRLVALGHRRIVLVTGDAGHAGAGFGPTVRTEETFRATTAARGLDATVLSCGDGARAGRAFASVLREEATDATALIVLNESAVVGIVSGLGALGVRVPEELSVLLIGATPEVAYDADPELALIASPAAELGRAGVDALIDRLDGGTAAPRQQLIMGTFVDGPSLAPPRATPPPVE